MISLPLNHENDQLRVKNLENNWKWCADDRRHIRLLASAQCQAAGIATPGLTRARESSCSRLRRSLKAAETTVSENRIRMSKEIPTPPLHSSIELLVDLQREKTIFILGLALPVQRKRGEYPKPRNQGKNTYLVYFSSLGSHNDASQQKSQDKRCFSLFSWSWAITTFNKVEILLKLP